MTYETPKKGPESPSSSEAVAAAIAKSRRKVQRAKKWRDAHTRAASPATLDSTSPQPAPTQTPLTINSRKASLESKIAKMRLQRHAQIPLSNPPQSQEQSQ
mmetsp:Transcript_30305/g.45071  ORF Transcript_30305/g.45071 Transcript_30305/m.45071 type:complete len:101 (-) Transcript_30305:4-306(-)